jgi:carboxyl-terminal processing protease
VKIDGELTRGITLLEAVKKLRGRPGTKVTLTVLREKANEVKDIPVERAIIKIESVREAKIVEDHIGYIRLSDFREQTVQDLTAALEQLKLDGMDGLILDLRNNPGGLLDVAVSVSQLFLTRGQLVVTTKGRLRNQNMEFRARSDGLVNGMPLVVLINEGSASASEIVAGAIQDDRHGIILGTKSHGKASVQTIFPLKDGSALRLTTSKYFTPLGRSIHGQGILPDVDVPFEEPHADNGQAKDQDKNQDATAEELFGRAGPQDADAEVADLKQKLAADNQLARAVDLLKGIKIYQRD